MITVITWTIIIFLLMGIFRVYHIRWERRKAIKRQYEKQINKALLELNDATAKFKNIIAQAEKSNSKDLDK